MRPSIALLAAAIQPALSWGNVGHRTVGYLAEKYLTDEAAAVFGELLANDRNYDMSDAATWADTLRGHMGWASKYHYVNPADDPPHLCGMKYPQDCPSSGCVISAIQNYTAQILDTSLPHIQRKNATMFVIHFLGDIHQPLHATGLLRGGNDIRPVCWRRQPHNGVCVGPMSLHSVWDTQMPHRIRGLPPHLSPSAEKVAAAAWAADLHTRQARAGADATAAQCVDLDSASCALGWASESNALVCSHVLRPGLAFLKGHDLSEGYFDENWEVVEEVLAKAGVRLGAWLNAIAERLAGEKRALSEDL